MRTRHYAFFVLGLGLLSGAGAASAQSEADSEAASRIRATLAAEQARLAKEQCR